MKNVPGKTKKKTNAFQQSRLFKKIIGSKALPVAICASIVFALCGLGLIPGVSFGNIVQVDMVASVGLVTVITWVLAFLDRYISRRMEENLKLDPDYDDHIKRYSKETVYVSNGKKYPLVELCGDIKSITFHAAQEHTYHLDPVIVHYMSELMEAHKTSKFRNKPTFRVEDLTVEDGNVQISASPSNMYCTLLTNRVMDFEIHEHITVREVFEPGPKLNTFANSRLNNALGFNLIARTSDGYYVLVKKTGKNPTAKFKYSTYSSVLQAHFNSEDDSFMGMLRQLSYNTLITNFNYPKKSPDHAFAYACVEPEDIHFLGLIRNLIEGGKPELAYVLQLHLSKAELEAQYEKISIAEKKKRGTSKLLFFRRGEYEILEEDQVRFHALPRVQKLPLLTMYILEKLQ